MNYYNPIANRTYNFMVRNGYDFEDNYPIMDREFTWEERRLNEGHLIAYYNELNAKFVNFENWVNGNV